MASLTALWETNPAKKKEFVPLIFYITLSYGLYSVRKGTLVCKRSTNNTDLRSSKYLWSL